jgi:hypothetical protein
MKIGRDVELYHKIWNENNQENKIKFGDGFVIHHKDNNPLNNEINNLQKMTNPEHTSLHFKGEKHPFYNKKRPDMMGENNPSKRLEVRKILSLKAKGNKSNLGLHHSEEAKNKMSNSHIGKVFTEEHKKHISENHKGFKNKNHSKEWKERQSEIMKIKWKLKKESLI